MEYVLFATHETLAGAMFYTCFCRALHMDKATIAIVRLAFWSLGLASILMIAAPIVSTWQPNIPCIVLMLAITMVQVVTSYHWRAGLPKQFQKQSAEGSL